MASFLYFVPNHAKPVVTAADFTALGLAHALTTGDPSSRGTHAGPEGLQGVLAVPTGKHAPQSLYQPDRQVWRAGPGRRYFVGYYTDAVPTPVELQREPPIPGEKLRLGDGNEWTIPIALSFIAGRGTTLPQRFVLLDDGETWDVALLPKHAHLSTHAEKIVDAWARGERQPDGTVRVTMDVTESLRICVDALACNYRIGAVEVDMLGLLTTDSRWDILRALIDDFSKAGVDELDEQKKSDTPAS